MKYTEFNIEYSTSLWIYRKDDGTYYVGSSAPESSDTKAKFNDITDYIFNETRYIDIRKFPFIIGRQFTITNDGLLLVDGENGKCYLYDVLGSVDTESSDKNLTTINTSDIFLSEDGIKTLLDDVDNKDGFFTKLWKYIPLYQEDGNSYFKYRRVKEFQIGSRIYYSSPMEEDDPMDPEYPGFYYTNAFEEYSDTFIMDYKYFYALKTDKAININNFEFDSTESGISIARDGTGPYYYIIKYLYNLNRISDKKKVQFKIKKTNSSASYLKIV